MKNTPTSMLLLALALAACSARNAGQTGLATADQNLEILQQPIEQGTGGTAKLRAESDELITVTYSRLILRDATAKEIAENTTAVKKQVTSGGVVSLRTKCNADENATFEVRIWSESRTAGIDAWQLVNDLQVIKLTKDDQYASVDYCLYTSKLKKQLIVSYKESSSINGESGRIVTEMRQKLAVKRGEGADETPGVWLRDPISKSHDFQFDLLKAKTPSAKTEKPSPVNKGG